MVPDPTSADEAISGARGRAWSCARYAGSLASGSNRAGPMKRSEQRSANGEQRGVLIAVLR
jgi:hypothetical protein